MTDSSAHELLTEYFHSRELGFIGGTYTIAYPDPERFIAPNGVFVLVMDGDNPVGCGGIRRLDSSRYEIKHLFLRDETRGRGWGRMLLTELENRARGFGAADVVLDTNDSLAAAGGLYRSHGYESIPPYNDNPNATTWYRKALDEAHQPD